MADNQVQNPTPAPAPAPVILVPVPPETKKPWQSKTILVNGILGLTTFLGLVFPWAHGIPDFMASHSSEIAMFWSVLNIVLRAVTKDSITLAD